MHYAFSVSTAYYDILYDIAKQFEVCIDYHENYAIQNKIGGCDTRMQEYSYIRNG